MTLLERKSLKAESHYKAFGDDPRWVECDLCDGNGWYEYAEHNVLEEAYIEECPRCDGYGGKVGTGPRDETSKDQWIPF